MWAPTDKTLYVRFSRKWNNVLLCIPVSYILTEYDKGNSTLRNEGRIQITIIGLPLLGMALENMIILIYKGRYRRSNSWQMWLKLQEGSLHEENPRKTHKIYAVTPGRFMPYRGGVSRG